MSKSPFDQLPAPNRTKMLSGVKSDLTRALSSLQKFCDSIRDRRQPVWPCQSTFDTFMGQLRTFRTISKRKAGAPPIQLIREMDGLWPKLRIVGTLDLCVDRLRDYLGTSLLSKANKIQFKRGTPWMAGDLRSLLRGERIASPKDLQMMWDLLPPCFQDLAKLASSQFVRPLLGVPRDTVEKLTTTAARAAQEYLMFE